MNPLDNPVAPDTPNFKFTTEHALYLPKDQGIYPIRESDWLRLKRLIQNIIPSRRMFELAASVFWGIATSALFSLLAFYSVDTLKPWIIPTTGAILIGSIILAIALHIVDCSQKQLVSTSVNSVLEEIKAIEQDYNRPERH